MALSDAVLGRLFVAVGRLRECTAQGAGFCHGDLTLENLMVDRDGRVWLVDFLDSPFEHPWQDYVKLQQDIEGGWYLRKGLRMGPAIMSYARQWLLEIIAEIAPDYSKYAPTLAAVNFSRILPYTRTPEERAFVIERVEHFAALAA
jgi:aminoglycoside/choline kinase family phosphotransferase